MPCPIHKDAACFYAKGDRYLDKLMPCWQYHNSPKHRALWDGVILPEEEEPKSSQRVQAPCIHFGKRTGERRRCKECHGHVDVFLHECAVFGTCSGRSKNQIDGVAWCRNCPKQQTAGIVIGSYRLPKLIELQIKVIRDTCGDIPILVCDDSHQDLDLGKGVTVKTNTKRLGHVAGDMNVFCQGLRWAKEQRFDVLCKLSQRMIFTLPHWLQQGAKELLESGLPLASRRCTGAMVYDLRSECCFLDVKTWTTERLERVPHDIPGESIVYRALQDRLGGIYWPLSFLPEDRYANSEDAYWYMGKSREAYQALAHKYDLELDENFHVLGWGEVEGHGYVSR